MINRLFAELVAELASEDVADPLAARLTLGAVWLDLARLAGETPPPPVAAILDAPIRATIATGPARWLGDHHGDGDDD